MATIRCVSAHKHVHSCKLHKWLYSKCGYREADKGGKGKIMRVNKANLSGGIHTVHQNISSLQFHTICACGNIVLSRIIWYAALCCDETREWSSPISSCGSQTQHVQWESSPPLICKSLIAPICNFLVKLVQTFDTLFSRGLSQFQPKQAGISSHVLFIIIQSCCLIRRSLTAYTGNRAQGEKQDYSKCK